MKGLTLAGMALKDENNRRNYFDQILKPLQTRLLSFTSQHNFSHVSHDESIKIQIIDILECIIG